MTRRTGRDSEQAESGFTLIELIIASALTILVVVAVSGLMISSNKAQTSTRAATAAATLGQLISRSVTQGVANATAVTVTTDSSSGAQLLQARVYSMTAASDPTQSTASIGCAAWYYNPAGGGSIYVKKVFPAAAITMPSGTPDSSWELIGSGLGANVAAAQASTVFATPSGTRVDLKFDVVNGSQKPVHVETTVHIPNTTPVSSPCF